MATVAGAGSGMMLPRRRRRPLGDLTNLSSAISVLTRVKPTKLRTSPSACSSTSSIGSSTAAPRCAPALPPPPPLSVVAVIKGMDKPTRELQSSTSHLKKIKKISKPKVKTGAVLPGASSPPSKKTRKVTREELLPHMEPLDQSSGEPLPSQDFIEERRAYFAEIDAFQLLEFVSSGSDLE